jgi:hypothetical protein
MKLAVAGAFGGGTPTIPKLKVSLARSHNENKQKPLSSSL